MSTITPNIAQVAPVASDTNAIGATKSGAFTLDGGIATLSVRMKNGATGPTTPCLCRVYVSHTATRPSETLPLGPDWFLWQSPFSGGTTANNTIDRTVVVDGAKHVCVTFSDNNQAMAAVACVGTVVSGWVNP